MFGSCQNIHPTENVRQTWAPKRSTFVETKCFITMLEYLAVVLVLHLQATTPKRINLAIYSGHLSNQPEQHLTRIDCVY